MIRIGLTGVLGSGKSTVLGLFAQQAMPVLEADDVAREVLAPGEAAAKKTIKAFGLDILKQDGAIDRAKLAKIVFADGRKLERLNLIVHPPVRRQIKRFLVAQKAEGKHLCAVSVPLLYETGLEKLFDVVVVVAASKDVVLRRVEQSGRMGRNEALRRLKFQMPLTEKCKRADYVLDNGGSRVKLRKQVQDLLKELTG